MSLGYLAGEEREAALRACHLRGANRLLQLCFLNGGIYTKLGQHVGQLVSTAAVPGLVRRLLRYRPWSLAAAARPSATGDGVGKQ